MLLVCVCSCTAVAATVTTAGEDLTCFLIERRAWCARGWAVSMLPFSTCWPRPTLARTPLGVSMRPLQRRGDANGAAVQQEGGHYCANLAPAHGLCNGRTPSDAVRPLRTTHFDPVKQTVEDLRVPHVQFVENDWQIASSF